MDYRVKRKGVHFSQLTPPNDFANIFPTSIKTCDPANWEEVRLRNNTGSKFLRLLRIKDIFYWQKSHIEIFFIICVITRKRIVEFGDKHPDCINALESWYRVIKHSQYNSFAQLRQTFPSADQVGKLTVFNIGGNKARLIAAIHYNTQRVYIRHVLTHEEYDRGKWKE